MANDRVFIVCKSCGDVALLLKFYPGKLAEWDNKTPLVEWLDGHGKHHPRLQEGDLAGDPGFELFTESDDAKYDLYYKPFFEKKLGRDKHLPIRDLETL